MNNLATTLHSFIDIFESTFREDEKPIQLKKIIIPIIQRDYAQGRKDSESWVYLLNRPVRVCSISSPHLVSCAVAIVLRLAVAHRHPLEHAGVGQAIRHVPLALERAAAL